MQIERIALRPVQSAAQTSAAVAGENAKSFGELLAEAMDDANALVQDSQQKSVELAQGRIEDVSQVMIAAEKASLAIQLTMQVRNKAVEAYQEVMRMQV